MAPSLLRMLKWLPRGRWLRPLASWRDSLRDFVCLWVSPNANRTSSEVYKSQFWLCWSHFINYLWPPVSESRHVTHMDLKRYQVGETIKGIPGNMGYGRINVTLKLASATKSDSQGHLKRSRHISHCSNCAYIILTYHCFLSFQPRNLWEGTHQGQLYLHFQHSKKFIFGVLPPSLQCSSFSPTPFPCLVCAHMPAS